MTLLEEIVTKVKATIIGDKGLIIKIISGVTSSRDSLRTHEEFNEVFEIYPQLCYLLYNLFDLVIL